MSFFSIGPAAAIYRAAFFAAALGFLASTPVSTRWQERLPRVVGAVGALLAALSPSDGAVALALLDRAHLAGMLLFLVGGAAALLASSMRERWVPIAASASVLLTIATKLTHSPLLGPSQRISLVLLLGGLTYAVQDATPP